MARRARGLLPFTAILLLGARPLPADDWPAWLGPSGDGSSAETGWLKDWPDRGPPRLFEVEAGEGYSAVSVAEGHLVLFHRRKDEELVDDLDPRSGRRRWRTGGPTDYVDSYGYGGGPRSAPIIEPRGGPESRVYTLGAQGVLQALELASGKVIWRREMEREFGIPRNFFGVGAAPVLEGDLLFLNLGGTRTGTGHTFAIDKRDGKVVWKSPTDGGSYAAGRTARIDGGRQLFIFHRGGLTCFDPRDGREVWKFPWRSRTHESVNAATPLVAGDVLFFSASYGTGGVALRVKRESYEVLWKDDLESREKVLDTHWSTASSVDGHLYGFAGRHEGESRLTCVELLTGKVLWRWESPLGRGSLVPSDGHFIALGERGDLELLRLRPSGHEELRRVRGVLRWPAWTPPVLSGGILYLRDEGRLLALDLRPKPPPRRP